MSYRTGIEWTDATWNPVIGCTKISIGCENCYAQKLAERFRGVAGHPFERGFDLRLVPQKLHEPLDWKSPRRVFVCSMSDLFHESIPLSYIHQVFQTMARARWHTFQVLTKRSTRMAQLSSELPWPSNAWVGATIESAAYIDRAHDIQAVPAAVRFISLEPLLGPIPRMPLEGIDWVIVGGESGPHARPLDLDWVRSIRDQCLESGVAFFFKQLGGRQNKRGREQATLDGRQWHQFPRLKTIAAMT